jgi:hypothetical protein
MKHFADKDVIDIVDSQQAFHITNLRIEALKDGFYALAMDYGFYIENTWGGKHKIFDLRDNVLYRFFVLYFIVKY